MRIQLFVCLILAVSAVWAQPSRVSPTGTETGLNLPTQRIGPDDLLNIAVYDSPELTHSVRVDQGGSIRLPMVPQPIKAAGLLPGELEAGVVQALVAGKILVNPVVTVTIAEYRSRPVSVVGAVKKPLTFQAFGEVTLLDAIARAEGLTEYAGPELLVTQSEADDKGEPKKLVRRIRVKELIDDANPALNLPLHGGEEIRVPEMGKVFVVGSVKKPGVFPVQEASGTSVLKILAYSEGLSPYASKVAYIYRTEAHGSGKNEIRIELSQIIARKAPDATLQANDILYVPDNKGRRTAMNTLEKILLIGTATSGALVYGAVR